jgi:hypothetical protein
MPSLSLSGQSRQRQIVMLAVGGVLLGGLLLFQVPRTLDMLKTDAAPPPPQPTQTTATPTPVSPTSPTPLPVDGTEAVSARHAALARFTTKDPFVPQVSASGQVSSAGAAASAASEAGTSEEATSGTASAGDSATIAVNGIQETVSVSEEFPASNPVFTLQSVTGDTARVGVANGELKSGAQAVTLTRGEPLTLLNTVDGKRYRLELTDVAS